MEERRGVTLEVAFGARQPPQMHDHGLNGLFFTSADGKTVSQFRVDGFTLNRLAPYPSWETITPTAVDLWAKYVEVAVPQSVTRVAVRFINQLQLPSSEFAEFLATVPRGAPADVPGQVAGFLTNVLLMTAEGATVNFTQSLQGTTAIGPIILIDIDASVSGALAPTRAELERRLPALRELKNRVFFDSITEKTASLFE